MAQQSPYSDMAEPVVTVHDDERGGDSFVVSGSEYRELLRIAREHVTMLKQMFQVKRTSGNPDWTATYWDCRQGLSQEDARAVSCMQFHDGITLYELLGTGHRSEEGVDAQVNVTHSVAEIVHSEGSMSFDVTDITEMFHDPQRRTLVVHLPQTTFELTCYDQAVLRALYYALLLRHQDIRTSIDPVGHTNQAVQDAVPRLMFSEEEGAGAFSPSGSMVRVPSLATPGKGPPPQQHFLAIPEDLQGVSRYSSVGASSNVSEGPKAVMSGVPTIAPQMSASGPDQGARQSTVPQVGSPGNVQSAPPPASPRGMAVSEDGRQYFAQGGGGGPVRAAVSVPAPAQQWVSAAGLQKLEGTASETSQFQSQGNTVSQLQQHASHHPASPQHQLVQQASQVQRQVSQPQQFVSQPVTQHVSQPQQHLSHSQQPVSQHVSQQFVSQPITQHVSQPQQHVSQPQQFVSCKSGTPSLAPQASVSQHPSQLPQQHVSHVSHHPSQHLPKGRSQHLSPRVSKMGTHDFDVSSSWGDTPPVTPSMDKREGGLQSIVQHLSVAAQQSQLAQIQQQLSSAEQQA